MDYETYCCKALIAYNNKEWYAAYSLIERVLLFDPENLTWLIRAIEVCNKAKKYLRAQEYCSTYLAISESLEVKKLLAESFIETNRLQEALEVCPESMKSEVLNEIRQDFIPGIKEKLEHIIKWIVDNGGRIRNVKVRDFVGKELGVAAANYVESESELLYVPKNLIIFTRTCINEQTEPFVELFRSKHSLFALFLALEKRNCNSFWEPYLRLLPQDFTGFPVLFTEKELKFLAGSSLLPMIAIEKQYILDDFQVVSDKGLITYQEFIENRLLASSRLYSIKTNRDESGLIPFADLYNHQFNSPISWNYDFDEEGFIIGTQEPFERNTEICISYGDKSNIKLLLGYGFALENNPYDEYIFELHIGNDDILLENKEKIVAGKTMFKLRKNSEDLCFMELIGFLRLKFCDSLETLLENSEKYINLKNVPFLSVKNEKKAIKHLQSLCEYSLSAFPTSLSEDINKLSSNLSHIERNCLLVTKGEKEVLLWGLSLSTSALKALTSFQVNLLEAHKTHLSYLQSNIVPNLF